MGDPRSCVSHCKKPSCYEILQKNLLQRAVVSEEINLREP
jgi:hypothetical protein